MSAPRYFIWSEQLECGIGPYYLSMLGLRCPAGQSFRGRLCAVRFCFQEKAGGISGSDDSQIRMRLRVSNNTAHGTGNNITSYIGKRDPSQIDTRLYGVYDYYTSEPGVQGRIPFECAGNNRRGLYKRWEDPQQRPGWGPNETLLVQFAAGSDLGFIIWAQAEWEEVG